MRDLLCYLRNRAFATFSVHSVVVAAPMEASQAFTTVSMMMLLRFAFQNLPNSVRHITEGVVALKRIQAFLLREDVHAEDLPVQLEGTVPVPPACAP